MITEEKVVLDTSVLIDGIVSKLLEKGELETKKIIIPLAAIAELQNQASKGRDIGFLGLEEVQKIQEICSKRNIEVTFKGRRPSLEEIKLARSGYIDAMIIDLAKEEGASLLTSDRVMYEVSKAIGVRTYYFGKRVEEKEKLRFEEYFDEETASLHIKEGVRIKRKKGRPGEWYIEEVDIILNREDIEEIISEILEATRIRKDGFVEIDRKGSIIVQLGTYRIVIVKPPVSDGYEITIVRPLKKLKLEDYNLPSNLLKRLEERAEGIVVAGRPGSGKTTFVQALAEWYLSKGKIVKTVESPRDLNVTDDITQYSKNFATSEELHDILLLARPDYVVFDEMRDTPDFELYKDLRLAGVGMVGVVHAERPIDAIQRFITRTELGMIPQIVDTIIFIEKGNVSKVYELELVVKVPTGMFAEDLARPVVEVRDFLTGTLEYEIYTFGEEIVVVPVKKVEKEKTPIEKLTIKLLEKEFRSIIKADVKVDVISPSSIVVYVPEKLRAKLIGRKGRKIERLEKKFGIKIKVKSIEELEPIVGREIEFDLEIGDKYIIFYVDPIFAKKNVAIYVEDKLIMVATISKKGKIRILKDSDVGKILVDAIRQNKTIRLVIA